MADEKDLLKQDEIERLLRQSGGSQSKSPPTSSQAAKPAKSDPGLLDQSEIEALLSGAGVGAKTPNSAKPPQAHPAAAAAGRDMPLGQDDVERLLSQGGAAQQTAKPSATREMPSASPHDVDADIPRSDVEYLLRQAEEALASIDADGVGDPPPGVSAFRLEEFAGAPASTENATLDLIRDVELDLKIELGRTHMYLEDVLKLRRGSVVSLDKLAGDPVDIYVNGRLIARGEVLVLNDNFCVRVAELIAGTGA